MLTDDELDSIYEKHKHAGEEGWEYDHDAIARAAIAAHNAKLLAGVELPKPVDAKTEIEHIPNVGTWYEDTQLFTKDQLQQYAAACAAQAREKALEEAAVEFEGLYSLGGDDISKCLRQMKGGE